MRTIFIVDTVDDFRVLSQDGSLHAYIVLLNLQNKQKLKFI